MRNFQELIQVLTKFWTEKGCTFHQGHDVEVGAGTFNPSTFLRCLGPEPYTAVYVEPSRRPQDGRYGKNPNRLQLFHQMQVVLKPSPTDIINLYLQSLEVIGFDLSKHDVRFVHDDWEGPTLGAWGLGWEVWIDGMEITQFTYFQAMAGLNLDPISVEITYGLERLCMLCQGVDNFFDMRYSNELTYGDVYKSNEWQWSKYNFEASNSAMWQSHFEDFEKEAKNLINLNLPVPAYDFVIKASHAFNMLEARGTLSTTERTSYIHRIRELAKLTAIGYLHSRKTLGFPLNKPLKQTPVYSEFKHLDIPFDPKEKKDFLLEIGVEPLPAESIHKAISALKQSIEKLVKEHKLSYEAIEVFSTPMRLGVFVKDLACGIEEEKKERRGPAIHIAFDDKGTLTKQGQGFFHSLGIDQCHLEDIKDHKLPNLSIKQVKDTPYIFSEIFIPAKSTIEILHNHLADIILSIPFKKSMRWADVPYSFGRPIHNLLAIFGSDVVPFNIGPLHSTNCSFGHKQRANRPIEIPSANEYEALLEKHYVYAKHDKRKSVIDKQLSSIESSLQAVAEDRQNVLNEVVNLTEWPELAVFDFDPNYLKAPKEILISEMVKHQRYFPLTKEGKLLCKFVITADNEINDTILRNNQNVLSARLSDGVFLYEQDIKHSLDEYVEKLKAVTFHKQLGSVYDKLDRIQDIALKLSDELELGDPDKLARASILCKADLPTDLVGEFPELQGTIGKHYALLQNEDPEVASAIEEHWLPNIEKGSLPTTDTGKLIALADKMDSILSYYSIGIKPSSSSDPYALRRQTIGIIRILLENRYSIDLQALFFAITKKKQLVKEVLDYFNNRIRHVFEEIGYKKDEIEAVIKDCKDPYGELCKLNALREFRTSSNDFAKLYEVYKRAKGQIEHAGSYQLEESLLKEQSEQNLFSHLKSMNASFKSCLENQEYKKAYELLATLQDPLAKLFDEVKILDENQKLKENRIALLQSVFTNFSLLLDFSKIKN